MPTEASHRRIIEKPRCQTTNILRLFFSACAPQIRQELRSTVQLLSYLKDVLVRCELAEKKLGASQSSFDANMDVELERPSTPSTAILREKVLCRCTAQLTQLTYVQTTPFLIRAFIKIGGFHRLSQFEDGTLITTPGAPTQNLPNPDEQQIYTWFVECQSCDPDN